MVIVSLRMQATKTALAAMTVVLLSSTLLVPWGSGGFRACKAILDEEEELVISSFLSPHLSPTTHLLNPGEEYSHTVPLLEEAPEKYGAYACTSGCACACMCVWVCARTRACECGYVRRER